MDTRKRRKIYTIIGICIAASSLFFFFQIGSGGQLDQMQESLYRLFGILAIVLGSIFVLFGFLKRGHRRSQES